MVLGAITLAAALWGSGSERLSASERAEAKAIYEIRCAACHRLYDPRSYADDEWRLWLARMSRKARLDPPRAKLLNRYLKVLRTESQPASPAPLCPP
jgi:hypothetical protein